jgi:hypothetical protein
MPVEVTTDVIKGGSRVTQNHEDGTNFTVTNGHLIVLGWDGGETSVAVYAPGNWISAVVVAKKG